MAGRIVFHVVPHTHWDREWYEPFEGYRFRLIKVVDRLLEVLDDDPSFRHFTFDGQTAAIEDYLEVRPSVGPEVERFVQEGRLSLGPWRILMDEFLCSPETMIRNIQQGTSRAGSMGGWMRVGYIPDSFGHVAQMPQLLRLAGLEDGCVWRGVPSAVDRTVFRWEAPDGSSIRAIYLARSYSNGASLPTAFEDLMVRAKRIAADLAPFDPGRVLLVMNGTDHRGPEDHLPALFADANRRQDEFEFRLGSLPEYLSDAPSADLLTRRGEMRSGSRANLLMGVVSARVPLKQAEFRASTLLERYAEPLSALAGTDTGRLLDVAWRQMVENSAHDSICGCGIDEVADQVLARYADAARVAELVARDAAESLALRTDARLIPAGAEGCLVFNPSPRARAGPAEITLSIDPDHATFAAPDGTALAAQRIGEPIPQVLVDMKIKGSQLARIVPTIHGRLLGTFIVNGLDVEQGRTTTVRLRLGAIAEGDFDVEAAKTRVEQLTAAGPRRTFHVVGTGPPLTPLLVETPEIAGLGWTTLAPAPSASLAGSLLSASARSIGNGLLTATVDAGGTITLEGPDGATFSGLLRLEDGGDAGDEYNYSPPERDVVVSDTEHAEIELVHHGALEARLRVRRKLRIPAALAANGRGRSRRMLPLDVAMEIALRKDEPFLRVDVSLHNRASDHRLRLLLPLPFRPERSDADTAFHVTPRGREAEGGPHEHPLATFPCRRWVDVSDGDRGLAVFHAGTPEYELNDDGLAVTLLRCVGMLSRQGTLYRAGPAGPALATPGAQLHGTHRFSLALFPHSGTWRSGVHDVAERFAYPLRGVVVREHEGTLPAAAAGLEIEPSSVQLSALVRSEHGLALRVVNASDEPATARIVPGVTLPSNETWVVNILGERLAPCAREGDAVVLPLRPWEIATILLA